jgi:pimeloyl-ACP methyl ester carboxylesterase
MPFTTANGIQLYYEERGPKTAEPLLLIMGITAAGSVWEPHVAFWEQYFRCIVVDNRGVGQSDVPAGPYTTAQMADDYAGILENLNIAKTKVVGVSMGSTIAQQLALRHPEKVSALVLMCPWARCDNAAKGIFEHIVNCKRSFTPSQFSLYIQLLIFSKASWDNETVAAELAEGRAAADLDENPQTFQGLEAQTAACISHNVLSELPKLHQPTLVIGGKEDIFTPEWMAQEVANAIPNAQLFLYEKCGHAFHFEMVDDFNLRVRDWLVGDC